MTAVAVYGATGHTGRFVVAELAARGYTPIGSGRRAEAGRQASVDDPDALDRALDGAEAVINAAGPFATTAGPLVAAAQRAGIPYVDVAAEIEANVSTFADHAKAETPIVPAMAFFGGLGDLLVTAAMGERTAADEIQVAYGLSSWRPTEGTRIAGQVSHDRRGGRRVRFRNSALEYHEDELVRQDWDFPAPLGSREVIAEFSMADIVTVPSHLAVRDVRTYMAVEAATDLSAPGTPTRDEADPDQSFVVDVVVRADGVERRAVARGRDIYAVTAPLAVEAVQRLLKGQTRTTGVASAGAMFDAADFLRALTPYIEVELP
ncbi:saccharopine dehydrogenase NADP-binding domain-containing protein [Kribbella sp. NPDC050470]|uniref:saccharopine dehydrogenase NADP-binding domain-containing protein n=1 Tax=unclassified Kribbella TaxID=2644121 RepID=UPI003792D707